ncbi:MAG: hypothetical protein ACRCZP_07405 [Phycicoccus sp.]
MAITNDAQLVAAVAAGQPVAISKTASATAVASQWTSLLDVAGSPGAGSLAIGNTAAGVVPTDATAGYPTINAFAGGATGYLAGIDWANTVACRLALFDRLWNAGSINANALATTTFTGQPSYLGRSPTSDGLGVELWLEINTAISATATTVAVNYTNEAGTSGRVAATVSINGLGNRRMVQLALQSGDRGVRSVDGAVVGGTVATAGTFNVVAARRLFRTARVRSANDGDTRGWDGTLLAQVYADSALWLAVAPDSTATGVPEVTATIING